MTHTVNKIRKNYRFHERTIKQMDELSQKRNNENSINGLPQSTETEVIEEAVNFYHAHQFGDQVLSNSVERFELSLSNILKMVMNSYMDQIAKAQNILITEAHASNDMLVQLIMATNIFDVDSSVQEIETQFEHSESLYEAIIDAELRKTEDIK